MCSARFRIPIPHRHKIQANGKEAQETVSTVLILIEVLVLTLQFLVELQCVQICRFSFPSIFAFPLASLSVNFTWRFACRRGGLQPGHARSGSKLRSNPQPLNDLSKQSASDEAPQP